MAIKVVKSAPQAPSKFLIIGEPFSGKTTLAAKAPAPLFVSTDGNAAKAGHDAINVRSTADITEAIQYAIKSEEYKTIVLDTLEGIVDIMTKEIIAEANKMGLHASNGEKITALADVGFGKLTGKLNDKVQRFADALALVKKNVVILSYSKRQIDEVSGAYVLSSEFKNIRLITRFMDAQVHTQYDGERYDARIISKREIVSGDVDLSEIEDFLSAIGWDLPKRKTKLGVAPKN